MAEQLQPIDLNTHPDLYQVVEEVEATRQARRIQRGGKDIVVFKPAAAPRRRRKSQFSPDDAIFNLAGIAQSEGPGDVSANVDTYLAEAYLNPHT